MYTYYISIRRVARFMQAARICDEFGDNKCHDQDLWNEVSTSS